MMGLFAFMITILLGAVVLVGVLQWVGERRRPVEGAGAAPGEVERLESALGALEARVNDLQDQQRFLERLVAERPDRRGLPAGEEEPESDVGSILLDGHVAEEEER